MGATHRESCRRAALISAWQETSFLHARQASHPPMARRPRNPGLARSGSSHLEREIVGVGTLGRTAELPAVVARLCGAEGFGHCDDGIREGARRPKVLSIILLRLCTPASECFYELHTLPSSNHAAHHLPRRGARRGRRPRLRLWLHPEPARPGPGLPDLALPRVPRPRRDLRAHQSQLRLGRLRAVHEHRRHVPRADQLVLRPGAADGLLPRRRRGRPDGDHGHWRRSDGRHHGPRVHDHAAADHQPGLHVVVGRRERELGDAGAVDHVVARGRGRRAGPAGGGGGGRDGGRRAVGVGALRWRTVSLGPGKEWVG